MLFSGRIVVRPSLGLRPLLDRLGWPLALIGLLIIFGLAVARPFPHSRVAPIERTVAKEAAPTVTLAPTAVTPPVDPISQLAPLASDIDRMWLPDGAPQSAGIYHSDDSEWIPYIDMYGRRLSDPVTYPGTKDSFVAYSWRNIIGYGSNVDRPDLAVLIDCDNDKGWKVRMMPLHQVVGKEASYYPAKAQEAYGGLVAGPATPDKWITTNDIKAFVCQDGGDEPATVYRVIFRGLKPNSLYLMVVLRSDNTILKCSSFKVMLR